MINGTADRYIDFPRRVRRLIGVACENRKKSRHSHKQAVGIDCPEILQDLSSDSSKLRVRRDGLITILKDGMEEEWLVDPELITTFERTGYWPFTNKSQTCKVQESPRSNLYGTVPTSKGMLLSAPISIQWDITSGCNLRCKHCYSSSVSSDPNELAHDEALRVIKEAYDIGVHSLHILGGEPFFRNDLIGVVERASHLGLRCHISSNGTLIDGNLAFALSGLAGLTVDVSLESVEPQVHDWLRGKGTYEKAMEGIGYLARNKIRFSTTCTVNPQNFDQMPKVVEQAIKVGAYRVQFLIVSPIGRALDNLSELVLSGKQREQFSHTLRQLQRKYRNNLIIDSPVASLSTGDANPNVTNEFLLSGCMAGIDKMAICADGSVTACPHLKETFGNVREMSLDTVWANMHQQRTERLGWSCTTLPINGICGGGCPAPERYPQEVFPCPGRGTTINNEHFSTISEAVAGCWRDCPFPCGCPDDCRRPCNCPGDCPFPCACPDDCRRPCPCPLDCYVPCNCPSDCRIPCMCPRPY